MTIKSGKKKTDGGSTKRVTRLDINLTDPLPTYEELLMEIFQTGSRQSPMKRHDQNTKKRTIETDFRTAITTTPPVDQPIAPPRIQPYEYPLNLTFAYPSKKFADRPISVAMVNPTNIPTPLYPTPAILKTGHKSAAKKKKSSKNKMSKLGKMRKSFTRRLKEHKAVRPTPTPFEQLNVFI